MTDQIKTNNIKETVEEFFNKMTINISSIKVELSPTTTHHQEQINPSEIEREVVDINIELDEPQILIGQQGQTLFEIQRLLRTILNKRLQKIFYLNLDINGYKQKKIEYLKSIAKDLADKVSLTKSEEALSPMSAYERRVVHAELSQRTDIITESVGEGPDRHILIKPR